MPEAKYYNVLNQSDKIGARNFLKFLKRFGSMEKVWTKSIRGKYDDKIVNEIEILKAKRDPDEEMKKLERLGIEAIIIRDKRYPKILRQLPDPPAILYLRGEIKPEDEVALAVVGSRRYSDYAVQVTPEIVRPLAMAGLTIVSGLALGVDTLAHQAALEAGGRTIGVLGCGLDQIYPYSNKKLAEKIIAGRGAIISEYPLGMPAMKYNFPVRNRIIAGLSLGILVIEGAASSGTLLTAQAALEYNREVFAVPGKITDELSAAPNSLIRMGAKLVTGPQDILDELNIEVKTAQAEAKKVIPESKQEAEILAVLSGKPLYIDKIAEKMKKPISEVSSRLTLMEMTGKVRNIGAGQYIINGKL